MPSANPVNALAIRQVLSIPRMDTYVRAVGGDVHTAMRLYGWNARASAALMIPFHFTEVSIRNAADEALTAVYGPDWPWQQTFVNALPSPNWPAYNPRKDLLDTRGRHTTTGKVIADLKFAFWVSIFTSRHDGRLWDSQILNLFPNVATGVAPRDLRRRIHSDLDEVRKLRNRVAHHEPIFDRDVELHVTRMLELIELRSSHTSDWVLKMEEAITLLSEHPVPALLAATS